MTTEILVELALSALIVVALLITCAVLRDARPPHGPHR
ncbi:hypothetical protein FHU35_16229 [Saccharopolyspora dendranthemae]|uniref:Uncharacterized protein n=1 Tax=Saccharopolyspora dendranthemae TaxID=1181886 RepID=A0A561U0P8_9PSEU|nr:hypothetical protein FHU35_16229 [Saccharopolyspora dendranthemae]